MDGLTQNLADAIGDGALLEKPFEAYVLVKSASEGPNGEWFVHGPAALVDTADYDGDVLSNEAVTKGLQMFERLGGQVDWEHQYRKTLNPACLIGRFVSKHDNPDGGAPIITTRLFKSKPLAQAAWQHLQDDGVLGYSLEGVCKARVGKGVNSLDIHMMTLTPCPKGFEGPRVKAGLPEFGSLVKSLTAEVVAGETDGWSLVDADAALTDYRAPVAESPAADPAPAVTQKAYTTGDGVVLPGTTTPSALRSQDLQGAHKGRKKKKKRRDALGFVQKSAAPSALVAELIRHGVTRPHAVARIATRR